MSNLLFFLNGPPRLGEYCYQIRRQYLWHQADDDLKWLLFNHGPTRQRFDMAIWVGLSFELFLAGLECPNGCAQLTRRELATRICPVCSCTGKTTPARARKRIETMQREYFTPQILARISFKPIYPQN